MDRLLIDTNIVIDLLAKREPFYNSAAQLFSLADKKELTLCISSISIANTYYILSKLSSEKTTRDVIRKFKVLVEILPLDDKIVDLALSNELFQDFEDGLQFYTSIENNIDIIISRNKKDFKHSSIPVLTAKEFVSMLR